MKYLLILVLILVLYLNRSYAHLFDFMGTHYTPPPITPKSYLIPTKATNPPLRYLALGDSLTIGVGSSDFHYTYPYLIAENLEQNKGEVSLTNLGVPGFTSSDLIKEELPEAVKDQPEYITILIGVNDIHNWVSLETFQKNYSLIVDTLKAKTHSKIVLINLPYLGSNVVVYPPYQILWDIRTRQFNQVIEQIAKEKNLKVIDLYDFTKDKFNRDNSLYSRDQFHPSDKGYKLWGDVINANSGF